MNIELYYQEKGDGLPMILLHGNREDSSYFKHQIEYFSKKYRVIAVDSRGHGRSPRGTWLMVLKQFSEDLDNLLEKLNISKAIVLGFSDGANVAMEFAIRYSDKVAALILTGGNLNPSGIKRRVQIPIEINYKISCLFARFFKRAKARTEFLALMTNEPDIREAKLKQLSIPTLVMAGTNDVVKASHTKRIAALIPNAKLKIMKGDHFIVYKQPNEYNKIVDDFLTSIPL